MKRLLAKIKQTMLPPGVAIGCIVIALGAFPPARARADNLEAKVEAAFIFQFTRFIEWPPKEGNFVIAVVEDASLATLIEQTAKGKSVATRPIAVRGVSWDDAPDAACEIMVFPAGGREKVLRSLKKLKQSSCLTVSYGDGLATAGVAVNFFRQGPNLKFEVNSKVASGKSLKVSSQLLKLAKVVE
jgi:hypothetical protein